MKQCLEDTVKILTIWRSLAIQKHSVFSFHGELWAKKCVSTFWEHKVGSQVTY